MATQDQFTMIKSIDEATKDLIYGYIRKISRSNIIPSLIHYVCLIYYYEQEKWDKNLKSDCIEIIDDKIKHINGEYYCSALLSIIASSGIHCWKFKIVKYDNINHIDIGIWKINSSQPSEILDTYFTTKHENGYAYVTTKGTLAMSDDYGDDYGKKCVNGDIIQMYLDLKFIVNNIDFGKAYDIQKTDYKAAVALGSKNNELQLLSYCCKYS